MLNYPGSMGWRQGDNLARWRGHLSNLLLARAKVRKVQHHAALPWQAIDPFMRDLRKRDSNGARAREFLILTAARTMEAIAVRRDEMDLTTGLWVGPAARTKKRREHRVPLAPQALVVLHELVPLQEEDGKGFVFPGLKRGRPLSDMTMLKLLERIGRADLTVHGFRSSFRTWTREATATPSEGAACALAHRNSDRAEAAYQRGDLFAKRRTLMDAWAEFCAKAPAAVHVLHGERPAAG